MRPRDSVYGSRSEHKYYLKLKSTWGEKYELCANIPFLNVFEGRDSVLASEYEFLKKSSVDFVVCEKQSGRPIICIEFDGMQHGHNVGTEYRSGVGQLDRESRRARLELKLRIAHDAGFPFFVLSGSHFKSLTGSVQLSVVDAIIGDVIASREVSEKMSAGFDPGLHGLSIEEFDALSDEERFDLVEDWAIGIRVQSDWTHNPVVRRVQELEEVLGMVSHSQFYPHDPDFPSDQWTTVVCSAVDKHGREASTKVCIPNFQTPGCTTTTHIANEIGLLVCLEQLRCASS